MLALALALKESGVLSMYRISQPRRQKQEMREGRTTFFNILDYTF